MQAPSEEEMRASDEQDVKAKEKETGEKGEHGSKGGLGSKGGQQNGRKKGEDEEDERVQVAPNMGAWWLIHPGHGSPGTRGRGN